MKNKARHSAHISPLRYPGGKNKLSKYIAAICEENNIKQGHYVEPYAGGAGVALYLLINGYVSRITINDYDPSIYAFWHSVLHHTSRLCKRIETTQVDMDTWYYCKSVQSNKKKADCLELGFSTFFLNRTNVSGILHGGVIGGKEQLGKYKIDCRFNKSDLIHRIKTIAKYKKDINLYNLDAIELINTLKKEGTNKSTIYYFDPPYYVKGKSLYVNFYEHQNHIEVSNAIKKMKNAKWVVSYDNVPQIKKMYEDFYSIDYDLLHTAHRAKKGKEVLFFSNNLKRPKDMSPTSLT